MKTYLETHALPDVIVPVQLDAADSCIEKIRWLKNKFGISRVALCGLSKGFRAEGYPDAADYKKEAEIFRDVRKWAREHRISCGWFCELSLKSGPSPRFSPIIRGDGSAHPFASCPLDPEFAQTLSDDIAHFAEVAEPDFIMIEDDFLVGAAGGCFCERHIDAFSRRTGMHHTRETVTDLLSRTDDASLALIRSWRALKKDSIVALAAQIRGKLDEKHADIPIGLMQPGCADGDGDCTEAVARALAGENHTPFVRLFGTFYCGFDTKQLPHVLYHALYFTQHLPSDILCYHETDTYPHTRYFTSGKQIKAMMAAVYSYGMVGSVFQAQQYLDLPFEEDAYGKVYAAEQARFAALCRLASQCRVVGVEVCYDPFYNTLDGKEPMPWWTTALGRLGIPFTSAESEVAFWDARQAAYFDDDTVRRYLSKGLILDGEAAKILCERGYGAYLGVSVEENILHKHPSLAYDLGAAEVITDAFAVDGEGREMPAAHGYCPRGNGKWMELRITDENCKTVTYSRDFRGRIPAPAMTYFENALGGKVVVMSLTVYGNPSQALFNYRRQRLLQRVVGMLSDAYPFVENAPDVYLIALQPKEKQDYLAVMTLINLCDDDAEHVCITLPPQWSGAKEFCTIAKDGSVIPLDARKTDTGIHLHTALRYGEPLCIIIR